MRDATARSATRDTAARQEAVYELCDLTLHRNAMQVKLVPSFSCRTKNFDSSKKLYDEIRVYTRIQSINSPIYSTIGSKVANHSRLLQQVSESKLCNTFSDIAVPISVNDDEGHPVERAHTR